MDPVLRMRIANDLTSLSLFAVWGYLGLTLLDYLIEPSWKTIVGAAALVFVFSAMIVRPTFKELESWHEAKVQAGKLARPATVDKILYLVAPGHDTALLYTPDAGWQFPPDAKPDQRTAVRKILSDAGCLERLRSIAHTN